MPPTLALCLWFAVLVALFYYDPARDQKSSLALWVPLIWMIIQASRLPSQWLDMGASGMSMQAMEEGNPLDRAILFGLTLLALGILVRRSFNFSRFVTKNPALICFLLFALLSICWSDFPFITFKRWIRDLGDYLGAVVVLTDRSPVDGIRVVLRRLAYVLVSLSIVLDKYFLQISRHYNGWTGAVETVGATTSKNMLGLLCLVSGLFFLWDTVTRWPDRRQRKTKRVLAVNAVFLWMTIWLLHTAQSTTSTLCLVLGGLVILASASRWIRRHPRILKTLIPGSFCLYLILNFALGMNGAMAQAVGKDPTLTDRTKIWAFLLGMHTNPLMGTGYQSFWLGPRLEWFWSNAGVGRLNEAHNGYLEIYLELGIIGVGLLAWFLVSSFRVVFRRLRSSPGFAAFGMAVWIAMVFYNMSEAAFETGLMYSLFLLTALAVPERVIRRAPVLEVNNLHGEVAPKTDGIQINVTSLSTERRSWWR